MDKELNELIDDYEGGKLSRRDLIKKVSGLSLAAALGGAELFAAESAEAACAEVEDWRKVLFERLVGHRYCIEEKAKYPGEYQIVMKEGDVDVFADRGEHGKWLFDRQSGGIENSLKGFSASKKDAIEGKAEPASPGNMHYGKPVTPPNNLVKVEAAIKKLKQAGVFPADSSKYGDLPTTVNELNNIYYVMRARLDLQCKHCACTAAVDAIKSVEKHVPTAKADITKNIADIIKSTADLISKEFYVKHQPDEWALIRDTELIPCITDEYNTAVHPDLHQGY